MVLYRSFRNTDPPALVRVWNEAFTGRGAVRLASPSPLEQQVFARAYFDPTGLIVAEDAGGVVGFAHAGFGADPEGASLDRGTGVVCAVGVLPSHRRQGTGSELLRLAEAYLRERGARKIEAGQSRPHNPFYQGLYGGSEHPGFLQSDPLADPFLRHHGYRPGAETRVYQRHMHEQLRVVDPRFVAFRQRFEIRADATRVRPTWWENCVLAALEPLEFTVTEKATGKPVAEALLLELEGFSWRWNLPAVGVLDLHVWPRFRRQGVAKYLLTQVLRFVQEQCFQVVELQAPLANEGAVKLCEGMGFEQVDVGRVYEKAVGSGQ